MATDDTNSFAMRHRARRAALLAAVIRRLYHGVDLVDVAVNFTDNEWAEAATEAGITMPSEITQNIVIGLLSVPALQGLVNE